MSVADFFKHSIPAFQGHFTDFLREKSVTDFIISQQCDFNTLHEEVIETHHRFGSERLVSLTQVLQLIGHRWVAAGDLKF
jgi:hypothetical protein